MTVAVFPLYEVPPSICCVHEFINIASIVSVEEKLEAFDPLQTTQTNQGRHLRLEPVTPAFHSSMQVWLDVSCVLLYHFESFIIFTESLS
jgi:hypothetical protein